jgi:glycosyltransferase involved in cell wall biosynthesis
LFAQGAGIRAGAERALLGRLRHLPDHGIEPLVAFFADGPFRAEVERSGVETVTLRPAPPLREVLRVPAAVRDLSTLARTRRVDVIEGCGEKMSVLAGWAARGAGCGAVYNLQDAPWRSGASAATQLAALGGRHDAIVVPSRWMAEAFRSRWRVTATVVPNTLVLDTLPYEPADPRALAGWGPECVVAGHFGRLVSWKGGETFLRAAATLRGDYPGLRWLVAGGTLYGAELTHAARLARITGELGIADRVHFTGHRDDAQSLMLGCDIVCHCSTRPEPFGVAVVEAMALGRAVVASRTGAPAEIIEDGHTGVLVEPRDDHALATAIAALLSDDERREALGAAARVVARTNFASEAIAYALAALYGTVATIRS